ncbi:MAG: NERD domain-containing protein [Gammaproteobacteria bacterium]|nr:NERD domain-containing protein [Gammaproteobacteria bacterium]
MIRQIHVDLLICGAWLLGWPSLANVAAESSSDSAGLSNTEWGLLAIGLAAALIATLIVRASAGQLARRITERTGQRRIQKILSTRSKDVLNQFILPGAYGGLTQIDHAILTSGGILCIQTKHYNGIVFGAPDEPQWTNVDGVHRQKFLNPLIQNEGRTKALQKVVPEVPVANLVVFTGSIQFTTPPPKNVIHVDNLDSYIAKFVFGPCKIKDWDAVWLTVNAAALTDEESRKDLNAQVSFC